MLEIKKMVDLLPIIMNGFIVICMILGVVVEKSPLPFKPLTWIGNLINSDIKTGINQVNNRLGKLENDVLMDRLQHKRTIALNFADKLRRTEKDKLGTEICTIEDFENAIEAMEEYHQLIEENDIPNGKFDIARDYIIQEFTRLSKEGKFIKKHNLHE